MLLIKAAILAFALSAANAHMILRSPPCFGFIGNKLSTKPDVDLNAPISKAQFPCKGYHKDPDRGAGKSMVAWAAGSIQTFSLTGGAPHGGGSCQVSLSYDNGETFRVLKSFIGNCPSADTAREYSFPIPRDAASGAAIFAWTWYNKIGNRELYMGCAAVTITDGGGGLDSSFPKIFVANIGEQCTTVANAVLEFPNPGAVVERSGEVALEPEGAGCV
ncbi:hypothetical protein HOY80DRAFT_879996 [Tuber brumale]|nr:hypothetical protein HOY80DRAFT_879996 [Tuber brumale]